VVTLVTDVVDVHDECYPTPSAWQLQTVLHALAVKMAAEAMPLRYAAYMSDISGRKARLAPLDFAMMDAEAVAALQQSLRVLEIACHDFRPQHWDILCSLHRVSNMSLRLQNSHFRSNVPAYELQNMQLTSLRSLSFTSCNVSLQPVLQHLSALTLLTGLHFYKCLGGWPALSGGMPPLHSLMHLTLNACKLSMLPCLEQLVRLETLNLDNNPDLRDVQLGLRSLTSLRKLSMRSSTPVSESTLMAIEQLPALQEFDIRGHVWTPRKFVRCLKRRVSAWHVNLIV
jgi:hypothetical protein